MNRISTVWQSALPGPLTGAGLLPKITVGYALFLIVYLPLESALIGSLPPTAYWVLRLLPDGLVVGLALAVVFLGDRRARTTPVRILWAITAVCVALVALNAARGVSVVDSINAIRLLVRYLILGLLVWWAVDGRTSIGPIVVVAVLAAGAVQIAIVGAQLGVRIIETTGGTQAFDPSSLLFVDGSTGRYDRLGLLLMSVALAAVATSDRITWSRATLLAGCMVILYLSTSRQAVLGMAVAFALLAAFPRVTSRYRVLAGSLAALSLLLVLVTPGQATPLSADESDLGPPPLASASPSTIGEPPAPPTPPALPGRKDEIRLSLDPNRNFRMFYNLVVAPWAAVTEPIFGFGPRQQVAERPDPRLAGQFEAAGMSWSWARRFTNDSNYASLVIQFGVIAPALFLMLLLAVTARAGRVAIRDADGLARFAVVNVAAVLVAAWFGPAFEVRMVSIILWVAVMAAAASLRRSGVTPHEGRRYLEGAPSAHPNEG